MKRTSDRAPLIAIVDDEDSVRRALSRLMRSAGFATETFSSGEEFLHWIGKRKPHCVVLDLHMPQGDGFEVQKQMSLRRADVPLIVITGHHSPETCARVLEQGARAYLRKPVDDALLLAAINAVLGKGCTAASPGTSDPR